MTDKEINAAAILLANVSVYQTTLTALLIEKGVFTQEEFSASIESQIKKAQLDMLIETYIEVFRVMTNEKPPEGGDKNSATDSET